MKLYLGIITNGNEYENIKELTSIWESFDGLAAVVHKQGDYKKVSELLNERKQCGFVTERDFLFHHGHSQNEWLLNPIINMGDWCAIRDSSERLSPTFAAGLKTFCAEISAGNVKSVWHKGKLLLFERGWNQQFFGGLHWGLMGCGPGVNLPDEDKSYAWSVRDEIRPKDHRYRHEVFYLINYGPNGNHLDLFWKNPMELSRHKEQFIKFLDYLDELGCKDVDLWGEWLSKHPIDERMKYHINLERPLRNYYRYFILKHSNEDILKDEDTWRMI